MGASRFFIGFIASQLLFSVLWDLVVLHIPPTPWRVFGVLLTFGGALLVVLKK